MLEVTQIIANIVVIAGVVFAIIQLLQNKRSLAQNKRIADLDHERRKKEATINFTHEIIAKADAQMGYLVGEYGDSVISVDEERYLKKLPNGYTVKETITRYLNVMNRISVGLNTGVYDMDMFGRICGRKVIRSWNRVSQVVKARQERNGQYLHKDFEIVVEKLVASYREPEDQRGVID